MKKLLLCLLIVFLTPSALASEIKPVEFLYGLSHAPRIGSVYNLSDEYEVSLYCSEKGPVTSFSSCRIGSSESSHLYLEMTSDNFSGRNMIGRRIEFIGIKHGQLFFQLVD